MKRNIFIEVIFDAFYAFADFVKNNLLMFSNALNLIVPYMTYFIGQYVAFERKEIAVGGEIFVPLIFLIIIYYMKCIANKLGKGTTVPIPDRRFTHVDEDGEVSIENKRIQELILYLADLEDWLERKGLL